jgi:hypothetical protein
VAVSAVADDDASETSLLTAVACAVAAASDSAATYVYII